MYTQPFWIQGNRPGQLAVSPRPGGGDWLEDEINHWREQKVDVVVSLLVPDEVQELNLEPEQKSCEQTGISFRWLHIVDREVPSSIEDARQLVRKVALGLDAGSSCVACAPSRGLMKRPGNSRGCGGLPRALVVPKKRSPLC